MKLFFSQILFFLICFGFGFSANSALKHELFTKIAVFPIADANYQNSEEAWWQMRESLTRGQRYLVASRRFMINRGVFQPRKNLKPADIVILGKILDAEALVTTQLLDRKLKLNVLSGLDGTTLWESSVELHPAIPINEQLIKAAQKLMTDFLSAIPYQGYQVIDEGIGASVFEVDDHLHAFVARGGAVNLEINDQVEWVNISGDSSLPFFNQSLRVETIAEGQIVGFKDNLAEVRIKKMRSPDDLQNRVLVRFPREALKLQTQNQSETNSTLLPEYLTSEMKDPEQFNRGHNSTSTALAFFGNLALLILVAF